MQRKLFVVTAAALLTAPAAMAQTNVSISGRFNVGWESYKLGDCSAGFNCRSESRVSESSSRIDFSIREDLGGGLSAWAYHSLRFSPDLGTINTSGNTAVGMQHNRWGKLTVGRWDVHYLEADIPLEALHRGSNQALIGGGGLLGQIQSGPGGAVATMGNGTRTPNLLMWNSPNWNGFSGLIAYAASGGAAPTAVAGVVTAIPGASTLNEGSGRSAAGAGNPGSGRSWSGALSYNNGPWAAGLSYWNSNAESDVVDGINRDNDQRSTRAWLGYKFPMGLNVGLSVDRSSLDTGINGGASSKSRRTAWFVPVNYRFGPHNLIAQYARAGKLTGSAIAAGTSGDYKAHAWMLGYEYAFSKRTSINLNYTKLNNGSLASYDLYALNGATNTVAGEDPRQIFVGMRHDF
jgi:predicted porin